MDEQAALEALLSVLMAKFSGANLIHDVGYMESGLTLSYEMILLTDELVAMTDHIMKGIEVNDETLMLDELDKVGPGGHFMDTQQTLKRFRDFWFPGFLDRKRRPQWLEAGATTLGQRLNARVEEVAALVQQALDQGMDPPEILPGYYPGGETVVETSAT